MLSWKDARRAGLTGGGQRGAIADSAPPCSMPAGLGKKNGRDWVMDCMQEKVVERVKGLVLLSWPE